MVNVRSKGKARGGRRSSTTAKDTKDLAQKTLLFKGDANKSSANGRQSHEFSWMGSPERSSEITPALSRPPPAGEPPAWADTRPALCDTLVWFRSTQGGCYHVNGYCYGFLIDADCGGRAYMDEEIIITRLGGGCEKDGQGVLVQKTRHTRKDTIVKCVLNTMAAQMPVGVVIGNRNTVCPSAVPHRYNVLAFFRITHVWFEGIGDSAGARVRLEKVDLDAQSWWMPQGMIPRPPLKQRTDAGPVSTFPCLTCGEYSPQVYAEGWMCLEESCSRFWKINGSNEPAHFTYNAQFLTARTLNPSNNHAPHGLAPSLIEKFGGTDPLQTTARCSWRGAVCPLCRRCNSRIYWDGWKCENEACAWDHIGTRMALPLVSVMDDADFTGPGAHPPFIGSRNELRPVMSFMKGYQRHNYTLPGIGTVTHYAAKGVINRRRGGPDEMFKMLQTTEGLGLRRYPLKQSVVAETLTSHFAVNYGMPYKYVVEVDSRPFKGAPEVLLLALNRLTWATKYTVPVTEYLKPNELLTLGYLDKMSIGYHDDGEESLGPTIATLSLGAKSTMYIRMKDKYYKGFTKNMKPLDNDPVLPGCAKYEEKIDLIRRFQAGEITKQKYDKDLEKLLKTITKKEAPPTIVLELHHGDLMVMHGELLQKYYEHSVKPDGDVRFAITARYIKPELVPESEHWKGDFTEDPAHAYDGDERDEDE